LIPKSRFVVPGRNDQDLGQFRSDSPTAPQLGLYFLMVISAAKGWPLMSFDVETAFLNGVGLLRELYCWPPAGVRGINPTRLWKLKKGVFGLTEAPRLWWIRIRGDLIACGWIEVVAVQAVFILKNSYGELCGVLVLHVDDGLLHGAGARYERSLRQLENRAPLKTWKNQGNQIHGQDGDAKPEDLRDRVDPAGLF